MIFKHVLSKQQQKNIFLPSCIFMAIFLGAGITLLRAFSLFPTFTQCFSWLSDLICLYDWSGCLDIKNFKFSCKKIIYKHLLDKTPGILYPIWRIIQCKSIETLIISSLRNWIKKKCSLPSLKIEINCCFLELFHIFTDLMR